VRPCQTCTIDDATDISLQPDIAQTSISSAGFARVFLRFVAQLGNIGTHRQFAMPDLVVQSRIDNRVTLE
jgi:hypothetical protein